MPKKAECAFCLKPFQIDPRIRGHRFCSGECRRKWHRTPSTAGRKREAIRGLIREVLKEMIQAGELAGLAVRRSSR